MFKLQKGLSPQRDMSKYQEFGSLILHTYYLNNCKLLVKYPSLGPVKNLSQTKISPEFRTIIKTLIRAEEINYDLLKQLESDEKDLFQMLMQRSQLGPELNFEAELMDYTEKEIIEKFNTEKGIIEAGIPRFQAR